MDALDYLRPDNLAGRLFAGGASGGEPGMETFRREFLKMAGAGMKKIFDVKLFGAKGDGVVIDSRAINKAIETATAGGGGIVWFPAGTYACYSIRLKSNVVLYLEPGATILAASIPPEGSTRDGYDAPESNKPWENYQDFGHNHWHNSLIWGKGLSRGTGSVPSAAMPGMGDKSIALKNCHHVLLRDFAILQGGHFAILATGVDNLSVDNLTIDTNRDGIDVDCCRNVRISNCSVNSPWDDAICPKSSFALGYARTTENVTISDCYVTGAYEMGTMLDGTGKRWPITRVEQAQVNPYFPQEFNGSIKLGTESNGGFKNIAISNCVFDGCKGFAVESSDGAVIEGIKLSGITMRDCTNTPIFLRLGARMRGPAGVPVGRLRGVIISDVVSYNSASRLSGGGIISGIPGHAIEDVKINNVYMESIGGGTKEMTSIDPPESVHDKPWPDPDMFADIPASGFFLRHVNNVEFTNVEIAFSRPDVRPVFRMDHVKDADFLHVKTPKAHSAQTFDLRGVRNFRTLFCRNVPDLDLSQVGEKKI
jgi:polygalacturonase